MSKNNSSTATVELPVSSAQVEAVQQQQQTLIARLFTEFDMNRARGRELSDNLIKLGVKDARLGNVDAPIKRRGRQPKVSGVSPVAANPSGISKAMQVVELMKRFAPNAKQAKTSAEIHAEVKRLGLDVKPSDINSSLQANRAPKSKSPKIAMIPAADGGRGGIYHAL